MISNEKMQKLDAVIAQNEKQFGKGIVQFGQKKIEMIPTLCSSGSLNLDVALGVMGIPKGKIVEIYGPESGGKTTLALHFIREAQKSGAVCAFIDAEHALDALWAEKLGVNTSELLISQPDCGEDALELVENYVDSGVVDIIVIDSVAALTPKAEIEGGMGDSHMGLQARLMSQALRKLTGKIAKAGCVLVCINQLRMKIGVMFGSPETTTGGNALKFYASIRLDVRNDSSKDINEDYGQRSKDIKVKIVKNKVAPPFKIALLTLNTNDETQSYGFDKSEELIDHCVTFDFLKKSGTWYSYGEDRLGQGKSNVAKYLKENPNIYDTLLKKVIDQIMEKKVNEVGSFQTRNSMSSAITEVKENNTSKKTRRGSKDDIEVSGVVEEELSITKPAE